MHSAQRRELVARFALLGATLGLLLGLFEAALLSSARRLPVLLQPKVGPVIWFLAPLADLLLFGVLWSALGFVAASQENAYSGWSTSLAALGVAFVGAYVSAALRLGHFRPRDPLTVQLWVKPLVGFAIGFCLALLVLRIWPRLSARLFNAETPWPMALGWMAVLLVISTALAGLGLDLAWRSIPSGSAGSPQPSHGPNIVMITLDTVRADHLSLYGYSLRTTPHIDRLADQGVLFENAVAPSSWTLASHASILAGLFPHQHGASWDTPMKPGVTTLADVLKSHGYETVGFNSNLHYGQDAWGLGQGFEMYEDDSSSLRHNLASMVTGHLLLQPLYEGFVGYDWFDRRDARQVNRDVTRWFRHRSRRPFFLFINYFDAHDPYVAPSPGSDPAARLANDLVRNLVKPGESLNGRFYSEQAKVSLVRSYDNCLRFLDEQVGHLIEFLASSPAWSETIVMITSDHGEGFGEHGTYSHGWNLYREVLHVPLLVLGPGIPKGRRVASTVGTRELFATVLDLALEAHPDGLPYRPASLRRFWTSGFKSQTADNMILSELTLLDATSGQTAFISLVTPQWHYIRRSNGIEELYNWNTDRQEKSDLASSSPEFQQIARSLEVGLVKRVLLSGGAWHGLTYLSALDSPGHPFVQDLLRQAASQHLPAPQALAGSASSSNPARPPSSDEDLLKTLPYH